MYKGTVIRKENMDAVASAAVLRDALRGRRRAADVPQELASHTNDQRQSIRRHYRLLTGKVLLPVCQLYTRSVLQERSRMFQQLKNKRKNSANPLKLWNDEFMSLMTTMRL